MPHNFLAGNHNRHESKRDIKGEDLGSSSSKAPEFAEAPSGEVYGEPYGRFALRRPRYAMGTMSGDQDIVTRTKIASALSLDP